MRPSAHLVQFIFRICKKDQKSTEKCQKLLDHFSIHGDSTCPAPKLRKSSATQYMKRHCTGHQWTSHGHQHIPWLLKAWHLWASVSYESLALQHQLLDSAPRADSTVTQKLRDPDLSTKSNAEQRRATQSNVDQRTRALPICSNLLHLRCCICICHLVVTNCSHLS